jgi:pyruvate dehydrogenase E1 component alpha subunit
MSTSLPPPTAAGPAVTPGSRQAETPGAHPPSAAGTAPHAGGKPLTAEGPGGLLALYRQLFLIRRLEEEAARAYAQGKIGGFLHLYIGQEAVAVGAMAALQKDDFVVTTYRDHGIAIAKGMSPNAMMAELYGKATGCSKGLGGSMHMFDAENHMLGGHGIIGAHIPLAAGAAFASKYRNDGRVTLCFFGDGAASIQGFHEGISLAAVWKLPIVFICENNEYSMGTPLSRTISVDDISKKAPGYGIPGWQFAGEDVIVVRDNIAKAVKLARETSMPSLLEVRTYRYRGHSMSDPGKYRTKEELEEKKKHDPVLVAKKYLEALHVSATEIAEVDASVEKEVADAVTFAEESPEPDASLLESTTYDGPFAA